MSSNVNIQLFARGVVLAIETQSDGPRAFNVTHETFEELVDQAIEARANKAGRQPMKVHTSEVKIGDRLMTSDVINVRVNHPTQGMTTYNLARPFGYLQVNNDHLVEIERPIQ